MRSIAKWALLIWFAVGVILWLNLYFALALHRAEGVYYDTILLTGYLLWRRREVLVAKLRSWALPGWVKFLLLAYAMVAFEETIAALAMTISFGFSIPALLMHIPQFILLNWIVFTPHIWVLMVARMKGWIGTVPSLIFLGLWGNFAEHTYAYGPIILALMALPVAVVYMIIFGPAVVCIPEAPPRSRLSNSVRVVLVFVCALVLAIPCLAAFKHLRTAHPSLFLPCEMIPC